MEQRFWHFLEYLWRVWLALLLVGASIACTAPAKDIVATGDFPSQPVWSFKAGEHILSLASSADSVFVVTTRKVYALDVEHGRVLWKTDVAIKQYRPPTICGDVLVVPTGSASLAALSRSSGTILWEDVDRNDSQANIVSVDCKENKLIASRYFGRMTSYCLHTGQILWTHHLDMRSGADIAIIGKSVFATTDNGVLAFDIDSGEQRFQAEGGEMTDHLFSLGNDLFVTVFKNPGYIVAHLDPDNGDTLERIALPEEVLPSTMTYANGILYFTTGSGVIAVVLENGNLLWKNEGFGGLSGLLERKPVILRDKLYIRDATKLHVLDASTGLYLGSLALNGSLAWDLFTIPYPAPIVVDQKLLVVTFGEDTVQAYQP